MTALKLRSPDKKAGFTATTAYAHDEQPHHHFFLSSAATWRTGYDLGDLIAQMQKEPYPFCVYLVPGPKELDYRIEMFAPQVEGATFLSFYTKD